MKKYKMGSELKDVPSGNKGLGQLPEPVRNKMGYKKMGGEKFLGRMMQMGGGIDMSDDFVNKMRKGGDTMKPSYKYGGAKKTKKMQMGGSAQSRVNGYKK